MRRRRPEEAVTGSEENGHKQRKNETGEKRIESTTMPQSDIAIRQAGPSCTTMAS